MSNPSSSQFKLEPWDNNRLISLCGQLDENIQILEKRLNVTINVRGNHFKISGSNKSTKIAVTIIQDLYLQTQKSKNITPKAIHLMLKELEASTPSKNKPEAKETVSNASSIKLRTKNQTDYYNNIKKHALTFGIGPAGTGKTFIAIACALESLNNNSIRRIILTRPAVEAGEKLGFLPGDLVQKIDPYCRPLYDALYTLDDHERVNKLLESQVIEVAPLAYMRGRTLNDAFIILDEAQNTTKAQMKMFLTRLGFNSTAVITGDITQIDLPNSVESGLKHAVQVLKNTPGISFSHLEKGDVLRHTLVQNIIHAYNKYDNQGT